jgi:hypothetical protein
MLVSVDLRTHSWRPFFIETEDPKGRCGCHENDIQCHCRAAAHLSRLWHPGSVLRDFRRIRWQASGSHGGASECLGQCRSGPRGCRPPERRCIRPEHRSRWRRWSSRRASSPTQAQSHSGLDHEHAGPPAPAQAAGKDFDAGPEECEEAQD